jgi:hypothetical protein
MKKKSHVPISDEEMKKFLKTVEKADRKGLKIQKNLMSPGWTITLPNGSHHNAVNLEELKKFVDGY